MQIQVLLEIKQIEAEELITKAWITAYYSRIERLPDLKDEISKIKTLKIQTELSEEMTDEELMSQIKVLNSIFGGKVVE